MSNKNRVNPDHYKVAGRDPQGEDVTTELNRQLFGRDVARRRRGPANLIPGALPVGEAPPAVGHSRRAAPMGTEAPGKRGVKSTSEKPGSSRHGTARSPRPAPVAGASGRAGAAKATPPRPAAARGRGPRKAAAARAR